MKNFIAANVLLSFMVRTKGLVHSNKSMFPSELFLFYCECLERNVDMIIESGTGTGISSLHLSKLLPDVPIISIDRSESQIEAAKLLGAEVIYKTGDANKLLPEIISKCTAARIGLLIDGPKGIDAVKLSNWLLRSFSSIAFTALHDLASDCPGAYIIHSHTAMFRSFVHCLDEVVDMRTRMKHPNGPGLTVFENEYRFFS